jgi:hypothetical protein
MSLLDNLMTSVRRDGWASGKATIEQIRIQARSRNWSEVANRKGGRPVVSLRPVPSAQAHPHSLSASVGLERQPLHTDGAHHSRPPDIVVLASAQPTKTPTLLWSLRSGRTTYAPPEYVEHGIFLVSNGRDSFFAVAYLSGRFRYDPGCMVPCDSRARDAARYFDDAIDSARTHTWDEPGSVLLIDNRHVLHARGSAVDDSKRQIERVSFHLVAS